MFALRPRYASTVFRAQSRAFAAQSSAQSPLDVKLPYFDKILIANRGEIACRVMKTAKKLGTKTVAVYSEADVKSMHVAMADEAVLIGPPAARESYLRGEKIIAVAKKTGAQAIHPGYGFLSENAGFADLCKENGLVFIGPPASAIRSMGSKSESKILMINAGVPVVPGYHGEDQSVEKLTAEADKIGYPILIKAVMGGGGKGMRIVNSREELHENLLSAQREAIASFGDDRVLIERYLVKPRHVEFQIFADTHGNCVYLFERDCSVQRRHQKIIEEAPAPGMSPELRRCMGEAAVAAAKAVNYVGAGTVEFMLDSENRFYFMEMNTRLQVEHPVSEMITRKDLVEWQLRAAAGYPLPCTQEDLKIYGHAFEARIYAENPKKNFLPGTGKLTYLKTPATSDTVRVETGVRQDDEVSIYYDPMIAKLVVWGENRLDALNKLKLNLDEYQVVGCSTNIDFLGRLATHPAFQAGDVETGFIEKHRSELFPEDSGVPSEIYALAAFAQFSVRAEESASKAAATADPYSPWSTLPDQRFNISGRSTLNFLEGEDTTHKVTVSAFPLANGALSVKVHHAGKKHDAHLEITGTYDRATDRLTAFVGGHKDSATVVLGSEKINVFLRGKTFELPLHVLSYDPSQMDHSGKGSLVAPMPGKIVKVLAQAGQEIKKGSPLVIMEAMKMEHTIRAPSDGTVEKVLYKVGDLVKEKSLLVSFS